MVKSGAKVYDPAYGREFFHMALARLAEGLQQEADTTIKKMKLVNRSPGNIGRDSPDSDKKGWSPGM